jgi:mycofactocin precursor peptide peptidase
MSGSNPTLGALTWPEVAELGDTTVLVVPVGSTEQHGPHLPLSTDTDIAVELARRLASEREDVVVAPPVSYGSSGEHAGFPGTLSIGQEALELLLVELGRSSDFFAGVVFLSAHGGNTEAVARATRKLASEGRNVKSWQPALPVSADGEGDAHAGRVETSVTLALSPTSVRTAKVEKGTTAPLRQLMPALQTVGVAAVSANGVLGDPSGASAEYGTVVLDRWAAQIIESLDGWP